MLVIESTPAVSIGGGERHCIGLGGGGGGGGCDHRAQMELGRKGMQDNAGEKGSRWGAEGQGGAKAVQD